MYASIICPGSQLTWKVAAVAVSAVTDTALIPTLARVLNILFAQNIQRGDNNLNAIRNEQKWYPEHQSLPRTRSWDRNYVLVILQDCLNYSDLPQAKVLAEKRFHLVVNLAKKQCVRNLRLVHSVMFLESKVSSEKWDVSRCDLTNWVFLLLNDVNMEMTKYRNFMVRTSVWLTCL